MFPPTAILALFTRIDHPDLLDHDLRRAMLEELRARPGATVGEMSRAFHVDYKTILHHRRMLERAGRLVVVREGRRGRCYVAGAPRPRVEAPRVLAALRAVEAGAGTPAELARSLAVPRGTAGSLLEALARRGLVVRSGGRARVPAEVAAGLCREGFSGGPIMGAAWSPPTRMPSSSAR